MNIYLSLSSYMQAYDCAIKLGEGVQAISFVCYGSRLCIRIALYGGIERKRDQGKASGVVCYS